VDVIGAQHGCRDYRAINPHKVIVRPRMKTNSGYEIGYAMLKVPETGYVGNVLLTAIPGGGFANQPAGAGVTVVSDTAGDTRVVTLYGHNGSIVETELLTLNGTTPVHSVNTDYQRILGFEVPGASAATITLSSAGGTISTIQALATQSGVYNVAAANQALWELPFAMVADNATTKWAGVIGLSPAGLAATAGMALTGATPVNSPFGYQSIQKVLVGDVESARQVTFSIGHLTPQSSQYIIGDAGTSPDGYAAEILNALDRECLHWCVVNGAALSTGGTYDMFSAVLYRVTPNAFPY